MIKKVSLIIICLIMIVGIIACNEEENNKQPSSTNIVSAITPAPAPTYVPVKGGTVTFSVANYNTLNPLITNNEDIKNYMNLVYDSMVNVNFEQMVVPELCESWKMGDKADKWYFTVRSGVKWHDGSDLTSRDIKATIDWIINNGGLYSVNVKDIWSCNILEDGRIELLLKRPDMLLPNKLLFPIIKKNDLRNNNFIVNGTSMYKLVEDSSNKLVFEENTNYWNEVKPYISKIEINKYESEAEKCKSTSDIITLSADNVYRYGIKLDYKTIKYPSRSFSFIAINNRNEHLQSLNVRRAIALCLDKENIINVALSGHGIATDWPVFPGSVYWREGSANQQKNIQQAIKLLQEDGYIKSDGSWIKNGKVLNLKCIVVQSDPELSLAVQTISKQLGEGGIALNVEYVSPEKLQNDTATGIYEMALFRINISSWPSMESTVMSNKPMNIFGFYDPEIDKLFNSFNEEANIAKQADILRRIKLKLNDSLPYIGLYLRKDALVISNKIIGPELTGISSWDPFESFSKWYVVN